MKLLKDIRTYFVGLLLGCNIWFTYYMIAYQALPTQYLIPVLAIIYILSGLLVLMQYKTKKVGQTVGKVLIAILCAILVFITSTYKEAVDLLDGMEHREDVDVISVVVRDKSNYNSIEDLDGKTFAYLENGDTFVLQTIEELGIKKEYLVTYTDFAQMIKDLYNKKVDAILLNEAYRNLLEDDFPNFDEETRVIYTKDYVTIVEEEEPEKPEETTDESSSSSSNTTIDFADITYNESIDVTSETFNVYITGIDTYGSISTRSRSDVNMILTINPNTKQILITSIPRDYYVPFSVTGGVRDKLTHSGLYGPNETKGNVQRYFGVYIPYYVRVNFSSLVNIVDAIGGIDIDNPHTCFDLPVGEAHLDGKMALIYARERASFGGLDSERVKNQARVIQGIINKIASPEIINNYSALLSAVNGTFTTNISNSQIMSLIRMQLSDMSSWSISTQVAGGYYDWRYSPIYGSDLRMYIPDDSSVKSCRDRIVSMY